MSWQWFREERFDLGILYGTDGGPEFYTDVARTHGRWEQRNINWPVELGRWDLGNRLVTRTKLKYVLDWHRDRLGRAGGFRWRFYADYVLPKTVIGTGDGVETDFQILQIVDDGYGTYTRPIKKPVGGTATVYLNDIVQASGWSLDTTTGILSFTVAPGHSVAVAVQCEFDLPVRFDTDYLPLRFEAYRDSDGEVAYALPSLPIQELRI